LIVLISELQRPNAHAQQNTTIRMSLNVSHVISDVMFAKEVKMPVLFVLIVELLPLLVQLAQLATLTTVSMLIVKSVTVNITNVKNVPLKSVPYVKIIELNQSVIVTMDM
jgi:hypothetical protein